jgi:hypothetical protein
MFSLSDVVTTMGTMSDDPIPSVVSLTRTMIRSLLTSAHPHEMTTTTMMQLLLHRTSAVMMLQLAW